MKPRAPRRHLQIDRVVLRGIAREQPDVLLKSLQTELTRLLGEPEFAHGLHSRHVAATPSGILQPATLTQLGAQVARRLVYGIRS